MERLQSNGAANTELPHSCYALRVALYYNLGRQFTFVESVESVHEQNWPNTVEVRCDFDCFEWPRQQLGTHNNRLADALLYTILSNCSISALNISLHLNSVGTYQVRLVGWKKSPAPSSADIMYLRPQFAKLLMLPCTYLLEVFAFGKPVSSRPVMSIILVLLGVGSAYVASRACMSEALVLTLSVSGPMAGCHPIFRQRCQGCSRRS